MGKAFLKISLFLVLSVAFHAAALAVWKEWGALATDGGAGAAGGPVLQLGGGPSPKADEGEAHADIRAAVPQPATLPAQPLPEKAPPVAPVDPAPETDRTESEKTSPVPLPKARPENKPAAISAQPVTPPQTEQNNPVEAVKTEVDASPEKANSNENSNENSNAEANAEANTNAVGNAPNPSVEDTASALSGAGGSQVSSDGLQAADRYRDRVRARLIANKYYPRLAQRRRMEGVVHLSFSVLPDGRVRDVVIEQSSGYPALDQAALRMVEKSVPFEPFPASMSGDQMAFRFPVVYEMN
ncbi:energy transducer TonB [Sneathiella chinensis]|uniref:Protein TonB n=1 Tax=Sneathiella chinensis TaxID=349750 RepID=A0ABQ5U548_9PROT|nr:energy transducer TonB [Sneathiella chinensis]GLQ06871.1 hypothetical protein GCM10007924_20920 [Sneathiella chinensis]